MKFHYPIHQSEIIACRISPSDSFSSPPFSPFTFCLVYRPPDTSRSQNAALISHLDQILPLNCSLLAGDFNYPSLKWDSPHTCHEFLSFVNSKNLFQHVTFPTRSSSSTANILDLFMTTKDLPVSKISKHPPLLNSDHFSVEFDLLPYPITLPPNYNIIPQSSKPRLNYKQCNVKDLNADLASYDWDLAFSTHSSPSSKYSFFIELLSQLILRHTPLSQVHKPYRPSNLINKLRRTRHRYAVLLNSASSHASQISKLKSLLTTIKHKLKKCNFRSESLILAAPHSRAARSLIKKRVRARSSVPPLSINNRLVSSNSEKATIFAQTFAKNFSPNNYLPHLSSLPSLHPVSPPISEIFPPWLIEKTSKNLPSRCGYTSHLANYFILKNCATSLALPLSIIFSDSLLTSEVPDSWKHATVIPIPKKGSLSSPENFRPISLTDPFARLFERVICEYIKLHFAHKFSQNQHGFLAYRSCTSSLVHSISCYKSSLSSNNSLDVIFFDFKKAFDKVNHKLLLQKLALFGIPHLFIEWFSNFLSGRTFSIKIEDFTDTSITQIPSGVPQGSVSGPLLFLIFINDLLLDLALIPSLQVSAFADDIKIYSSNPVAVQKGIDLIETWASSNSLPLAHTKTSFLRLGSKNISFPYFIAGQPIETSKSVRDLGLITDSTLKFKSHINKTIASALLRTKQLLKSFKSTSPQFYIFLFNCYVLPIIEYCSVVYSPPPASKLSLSLETPLRFFTRKIFQRCNITYSSYSDRLAQLNLFSLRHRRLKSQLLLLYKFLSGTSYFPHLESYIRFSSSTRRPMNLICIKPKCSDFFSHTIPIWNAITSQSSYFLSPSEFNTLISSSITRY
ncbi:hypothetical protein CRE_23736 [Caenorhabditis remanei]|uniref:Reverse transcriptase domain-containing protein n=1 Tax=Caenorhabditis remanei TaxID=31234 RepID=E3NFV2_CAERE|nr:hypothetical protein CRE_23736 [Caenorhabditis remanei]